MVPWLRICGDATSSAASISRLNLSRTTGCRTISVSGVMAPISRPLFNSLMPLSSLICPRSTTAFGFFRRSLSQSMLSRPPASTIASVPCLSSSLIASSILAGWYSSNTGMTSRITAIGLSPQSPLNVGREGLVCPLAAVFERGQNYVERHRRLPEDLVADRVRDRVHDRSVRRADRRFADAADARGRLRIGQADRFRGERHRRVENRRRFVLVEAARERDAVVLVVGPALRLGVAQAQHRAAEELTLQAARVEHRADVGDRRVVDYLDDARLGVHFDFGEADDERLRLAVAGIRILRDRHQ